MKFTPVVLAVAQVASAHYFFDTVVQDGTAGKSFQYIRDFTRATKYNPIKFSNNPAADIRDGSYIDGPDSRCNQGAYTNAAKTEVLDVTAGSDVTVKLGVGATMQHPGPALYYMSKAPDGSVKDYDGSGDWFKIGETGVCTQSGDFTKDAWCTWDKNTLTATIPKDTPSGEYLLRFEHIGVHKSFDHEPEHFVSCVQVKVTGGGNGIPGPLVKFPGAYKYTDPYVSFSLYNGYKAFPMPGPAVWTGGSSDVNNTSAAEATVPSNLPSTTLITATRSATPSAKAAAGCAKLRR
ncbi:fungal cellulose binding domain-containing protein [Colletotrichum lupini]|uniref:lytic cellulose monooxygenase (C4-dehydrogenating) n=1 Tax=Colletotrichum lupini TaxID=145971 RepID=A0A9Q8WI97_9PEZI|nr:fungal cellulose binding domain-containing protein [Colletotrichum lupini]KAK1707618.1 glycosyl hydrolase family 61-domain-containing protein [Colletotrichum lupini]UQC83797.1 fungal cellulose binding domain-containing protein [Colletotrichum lupini]